MEKGLEVQDAAEWDEFTKDFTKTLFLPYCVVIHDVGDWGSPANKLIKLKGAVAHFLWQELKGGDETISKQFISRLACKTTENFLDVPAINQIASDIQTFAEDLKKIEVIS